VTLARFVDTHCHLDFHDFDLDRDEVLARAWKNGLEMILNPGIDLKSSQAAVDLSEAHERVFAAVGVHPNSALSWNEHSLDGLRRLAKHPKVVAIGEIGLDHYRQHAPHDLQKTVFLAQLDLATELGLPVIIHSRGAAADVLATLKDWWAGLKSRDTVLAHCPGVLHSYSDRLDLAIQAVEMNFFIGVTGPVTYKNAGEVRQVVQGVALENLLIETDAPFLTPQAQRGRRNEPAYVPLVAEKIAELHQHPLEKVAEVTTQNAIRLFKWETRN
jgi:TatD DNase family protein